MGQKIIIIKKNRKSNSLVLENQIPSTAIINFASTNAMFDFRSP